MASQSKLSSCHRENNDLLHQFVFKGIAAQQANAVQFKFEGNGGLAYQVVGRDFTPWEEKPARGSLCRSTSHTTAPGWLKMTLPRKPRQSK